MASIAFHDPRLSSTSGGGETVTIQLVEHLLAANHDVTVITRRRRRSPMFTALCERQEGIACVELDDNSSSTSIDTGDDTLRLLACDRLAHDCLSFNLASQHLYESRRFDLVVVSFILDLAMLATRDRVLLNVFGLPPDREVAAIERPLLSRCARMTFASNYTRETFGELFELDGRRLGPVVYGSIDGLFFESAANNAGRDVCFVGRLTHRKGLQVIFEAIALLKRQTSRRITLAVVGDGELRTSLESLALDLGIADQVAWHGALGSADVARVMSCSKCFVSPSLKPEAFALGNIEAMAIGVPVITTNLGGTGDYVRPGENALVFRTEDPDDLARSVVRCLDEPELASRLATAGRLTAERFHPAKTGAAWLRVFDEILIAVP